MAWSFSALGLCHEPLLDAISAAALRRISEANPETLLSLAWAFSFLELHDTPLMQAIAAASRALGRSADEKHEGVYVAGKSVQSAQAPSCSRDGSVPAIMLNLGDAYVLAKPVGWAVDARAPWADPAEAARNSIVDFVRGHFPHAPIVHDARCRHGILHRLDANSSGLVIGALSYEAYYDLHLQLDSGSVEREYIALVHGWVPPESILVNARVKRVAGSRSEVAEDGKPSATRLKVLAHLQDASRSLDHRFSLVSLRLITGRSHQIRAHMQYLGHPIVCDAKYTSDATLEDDRQWCPRNFLHRYRVAFRQASGSKAEALQPLPADLILALAALAPVCEDSAAAQFEWMQDARPPPAYAHLVRLQGQCATAVADEAPWPPTAPGAADGNLQWWVRPCDFSR